MDFTFLPPEVNSARMYAGPGSGSLLAAAAGWDSLAVELSTTTDSYESVLSSLTNLDWRGPAAAAMAATAAPYMGWLRTTAQLAKQAARQAWAAAAAYEQAWISTVPPATITANRNRQKLLIATNYVGQNTAAIAATEAQYADFWAQDTAAMSGYEATSAAAAAQLVPFSSPDPTTNADAQTTQDAAVTQAVNNATTSSSVQQAVAQAVDEEALPSSPPVANDFAALDGLVASFGAISSTQNIESFATGIIGAESNLGVLPSLGAAATAPALIPSALGAAPALTGATAGLGGVTASVGGAGSIGPVSVPASWSAPSTISPISPLAPAGMTTIPGTDGAVASGYPGYPGVPAGAAARGAGAGVPPRYGVRLTVMGRPPAAG